MTEAFSPDVQDWFERRTVSGRERPLAEVAASKRTSGLRVSVCLPALDEAETIGSICRTIREDLLDAGIVDELIVVDSGSIDETTARAREEGAAVFLAREILPGLPPTVSRPGKGEAMWKSLAVSSGDIVVWIDSDIRDFSSHFVSSLIAPLLEDPELVMTKGFYERPLESDAARDGGEEPTARGGRVTELAARPLIQLLCPVLSGLVQPLSGEYALRRSAAVEIPFVSGYGVDVALLVDVVLRYGLDSLVQVDLGRRVHRNRDLLSLGRTSFQVIRALLLRLHEHGLLTMDGELPAAFTQFVDPAMARTASSDLDAELRPPMGTVQALL